MMGKKVREREQGERKAKEESESSENGDQNQNQLTQLTALGPPQTMEKPMIAAMIECVAETLRPE